MLVFLFICAVPREGEGVGFSGCGRFSCFMIRPLFALYLLFKSLNFLVVGVCLSCSFLSAWSSDKRTAHSSSLRLAVFPVCRASLWANPHGNPGHSSSPDMAVFAFTTLVCFMLHTLSLFRLSFLLSFSLSLCLSASLRFSRLSAYHRGKRPFSRRERGCQISEAMEMVINLSGHLFRLFAFLFDILHGTLGDVFERVASP